eukprot:SAG22_NODE_496_length_9797_cov_4.177241_9_plen_484_part_00
MRTDPNPQSTIRRVGMPGAGLPSAAGAEPLFRSLQPVRERAAAAADHDISTLRQTLGLWHGDQEPAPGEGGLASSWELGAVSAGENPGIGLASPADVRAASLSEVQPGESDEEIQWNGRMEAAVSRWFRWQLSVLGFGTGREGLGSRFLRVLCFASAFSLGIVVACSANDDAAWGVWGSTTAAVLAVWWMQQAESKLGRCAAAARLVLRLLVALVVGWLAWAAVLGLLADLWRGDTSGDPYGVAFYILWPPTSMAAGVAFVKLRGRAARDPLREGELRRRCCCTSETLWDVAVQTLLVGTLSAAGWGVWYVLYDGYRWEWAWDLPRGYVFGYDRLQEQYSAAVAAARARHNSTENPDYDLDVIRDDPAVAAARDREYAHKNLVQGTLAALAFGGPVAAVLAARGGAHCVGKFPDGLPDGPGSRGCGRLCRVRTPVHVVHAWLRKFSWVAQVLFMVELYGKFGTHHAVHGARRLHQELGRRTHL